jgi:NET1-associated nuclear protein 1 (U3 small nucleolar RNA-associated protein 17)
VFDPSAPVTSPARKPKTRPLPHPVRQALWLPSLVAGEDDVSLAVTAADSAGSVALVGSAARSSVAAGAGAASRLPLATEGTTRLFDEIFGEASDSPTARKGTSASASASRTSDQTVQVKRKSGGGILGSTDGEGAPAHTLPPVRMLWREVFRDAFAHSSTTSAAATTTGITATAASASTDSQQAPSTVPAESAKDVPTWSLGDSDAVRRIFSARLGL